MKKITYEEWKNKIEKKCRYKRTMSEYDARSLGADGAYVVGHFRCIQKERDDYLKPCMIDKCPYIKTTDIRYSLYYLEEVFK